MFNVGPIQLLQGSVLGPVFFIMYAADLQELIEQHQLTPYGYALTLRSTDPARSAAR